MYRLLTPGSALLILDTFLPAPCSSLSTQYSHLCLYSCRRDLGSVHACTMYAKFVVLTRFEIRPPSRGHCRCTRFVWKWESCLLKMRCLRKGKLFSSYMRACGVVCSLATKRMIRDLMHRYNTNESTTKVRRMEQALIYSVFEPPMVFAFKNCWLSWVQVL